MSSTRPLTCALALMLGSTAAALSAAENPIYELRVYTCEPGKLELLHARFRDHTCKLFEKHGMKNIAYWQPVEGDTASNTLIYVLEHASRDAATQSWAAFRSDPEWMAIKAETEQEGKFLTKPVESTFMALTDYSAKPVPVDPSQLYELRVYVTHPGKLDALHARFRDHTCQLFEKHGMQNVAYWTPLDEPAAQNTLIYFVSHADRDASQGSWTAFIADPVWHAARDASEKDGAILSQRPDATFLRTVDYSPQPVQ